MVEVSNGMVVIASGEGSGAPAISRGASLEVLQLLHEVFKAFTPLAFPLGHHRADEAGPLLLGLTHQL